MFQDSQYSYHKVSTRTNGIHQDVPPTSLQMINDETDDHQVY